MDNIAAIKASVNIFVPEIVVLCEVNYDHNLEKYLKFFFFMNQNYAKVVSLFFVHKSKVFLLLFLFIINQRCTCTSQFICQD